MRNTLTGRDKAGRCLRLVVLASLALFLVLGQSSAGEKGRGYLGIYIEQLDDETRESLKFKGDGIFVDDVEDDSPADEAGLEDGDVIITFKDKAVKDVDELRKMIASSKPGDKASIVVFRDGKEVKLTAKVGEADDDIKGICMIKRPKGHLGRKLIMKHECCPTASCGVWLGVEVQKLSDQLAEYFKVTDGTGMLVATVIKDAPAEKAGIKAGDIIIRIGDEEIENRADMREAICEKKAGDAVDVTLLRDGQKKSLKVTLAEMPIEQCEKVYEGEKGLCWSFGPEGLKLDLEGLMPRIERHMIEIPERFDCSMEDLKVQLDQLRKELEKLKIEMESK